MITIDKALMIALRRDIDAALQSVGSKHAVKLQLGRGTYDTSGAFASYKLEVARFDDNGEVETPEVAALKKWGVQLLGFTEAQLTERFQMGGETFTLHGYNARAPKRSILIKRVTDGKVFVTSEEVAKRCFARVAQAPRAVAIGGAS